MMKFRYFLIILTLLTTSLRLDAQHDELKLGLRMGHNAVYGEFAAISLEANQSFYDMLRISGGIQYNTISKTAIEVRPAYFKDYDWGRVSPELLLYYSNLSSINSAAFGVGADVSGKWISGKLGYYYRLYASKTDMINEPFNIYYELLVNTLPMIDKWDLQFVITNNEIFELERHYQPSFIAQCRYNLPNSLALSMGVGCKPAGIFNISADYYQTFLNLGVSYLW